MGGLKSILRGHNPCPYFCRGFVYRVYNPVDNTERKSELNYNPVDNTERNSEMNYKHVDNTERNRKKECT